MAWVTAKEVKDRAQVDHTDFREGFFPDENALDTNINEVILPGIQSHINKHCERDFDVDFPEGVPPAIKLVAREAAANTLQYMVLNKMGPLVREEQFKLLIPEQVIFTPSLMKILASWRFRQPHVKSTSYGAIDESSSANES